MLWHCCINAVHNDFSNCLQPGDKSNHWLVAAVANHVTGCCRRALHATSAFFDEFEHSDKSIHRHHVKKVPLPPAAPAEILKLQK